MQHNGHFHLKNGQLLYFCMHNLLVIFFWQQCSQLLYSIVDVVSPSSLNCKQIILTIFQPSRPNTTQLHKHTHTHKYTHTTHTHTHFLWLNWNTTRSLIWRVTDGKANKKWLKNLMTSTNREPRLTVKFKWTDRARIKRSPVQWVDRWPQSITITNHFSHFSPYLLLIPSLLMLVSLPNWFVTNTARTASSGNCDFIELSVSRHMNHL